MTTLLKPGEAAPGIGLAGTRFRYPGLDGLKGYLDDLAPVIEDMARLKGVSITVRRGFHCVPRPGRLLQARWRDGVPASRDCLTVTVTDDTDALVSEVTVGLMGREGQTVHDIITSPDYVHASEPLERFTLFGDAARRARTMRAPYIWNATLWTEPQHRKREESRAVTRLLVLISRIAALDLWDFRSAGSFASTLFAYNGVIDSVFSVTGCYEHVEWVLNMKRQSLVLGVKEVADIERDAAFLKESFGARRPLGS